MEENRSEDKKPPIEINGKRFPLWSQFVHRKDEWIGGILTETYSGGEFPPGRETRIVDIVLRPNGSDSAWFEIAGEDFGCGGDVQFVAIDVMRCEMENGITAFAGYGGHRWTIKTKEAK